ncbi:sugar transporter [Sedimentimonas flavescens]|uniref:sugar transporter n=1 Tax=Sedimentimonas flavescens TaxID=2851012 RepID=UPI0021A80A0A|nr:sugar transporter [Sedimentimonas flavescens]
MQSATVPLETPRTVAQIRPAAGPARLRRRHVGLIGTFVLCVVIPACLWAAYLFAVARDQFASTMAFSVRKHEVGAAVQLLGGLTELGSSGPQDGDILQDYIQSPALVRAVDRRVDLAAAFTRPDDPVFSLGTDRRIEALSAHWQRQVHVYHDGATGLIELRVEAFDPSDAQAIATAIYEESSALINRLSAIAREDTIRNAREDRDKAIARLKAARTALTAFRSRTQIVDPASDAQGRAGLLNTLQEQLAAALIELDLLLENTSAQDVRVVQARQKAAVIRERLAAERSQFGRAEASDPQAFPELVGEYESLSVDLQFAEQSYLAALAAYDAALAEAQRKTRYLASHVPPTLAETAEYPRRFVLLAAVAGALMLGWSILAMAYYALRDRR